MELVRNKGQLPGITTGFRDIDKMLGGLKKTDLVVLLRLDLVWEKRLRLTLAENAAMAGRCSCSASGESKEQLGRERYNHVNRVWSTSRNGY